MTSALEDRVDSATAFDELARQRRSVYFYLDREVPRHLLERALSLAVLAPNHHHSKPWRFTVISGAGRKRLADAYADAAARMGWDTARARHRACDAPVMIVVGCVPATSNPRVRPLEEEFSTAAACQNLMLALTSMGLGSVLNTSPIHVSQEVEELAGISRGRVVGVLQVGYRDPGRELFRRPPPNTEHVVRWIASAT